jgi:hypothetical protein
MATGSVIVGRKSFAYAGHWSGDHHGVPIFVPTRGTRHSRKGDTVGRAGLFRDCRLRRPRPGPRHRGFAGDAGRGSSTLTLEDVTTPSEYRLYRATIGGAFVLCPREPRQPCPVHGIAADHRAPVVPWRHPV